MVGHAQALEDIASLGGEAASLAYKEFEFKEGDVVYMKLASGGGYGNPLERDPRNPGGQQNRSVRRFGDWSN